MLDARAKASLAGQDGAVAADMESHAVATAAAAAGLPFIIVRTIADPHERTVPAWAMKAIGADGKLRPGAVAWGVLSHPGDLANLIALGGDERRALATLRRVGALAGEGFGLA